jgi:hypothetical protein
MPVRLWAEEQNYQSLRSLDSSEPLGSVHRPWLNNGRGLRNGGMARAETNCLLAAPTIGLLRPVSNSDFEAKDTA